MCTPQWRRAEAGSPCRWMFHLAPPVAASHASPSGATADAGTTPPSGMSAATVAPVRCSFRAVPAATPAEQVVSPMKFADSAAASTSRSRFGAATTAAAPSGGTIIPAWTVSRCMDPAWHACVLTWWTSRRTDADAVPPLSRAWRCAYQLQRRVRGRDRHACAAALDPVLFMERRPPPPNVPATLAEQMEAVGPAITVRVPARDLQAAATPCAASPAGAATPHSDADGPHPATVARRVPPPCVPGHSVLHKQHTSTEVAASPGNPTRAADGSASAGDRGCMVPCVGDAAQHTAHTAGGGGKRRRQDRYCVEQLAAALTGAVGAVREAKRHAGAQRRGGACGGFE